jgi:hypothetical protein
MLANTMNSEPRPSEHSDATSSLFEPAVLSYTQFRNRECLLAWRRRRREHEVRNRSRARRPDANSLASEL